MITLALDSTAKAAAVAILKGRELVAKDMHDDGNTHSSTLLPMVERLLSESSLSIDDIDLFAASSGPGSFTGVRIGAATIKGLAFGKDKPCAPVSSLQALAYNMRDEDCIVCALMDARRGQFYTATFEVKGGRVERLTPDEAKSGEDIAKALSVYDRVYLVGDGAEVSLKYMGENAAVAPRERLLADGESVALCALDSDVRVSDAEFAPTYLRLPQAERERLERENKTK